VHNAKIQRRPLRSEAEKRPSGGGPLGPERTGMTGYAKKIDATAATLKKTGSKKPSATGLSNNSFIGYQIRSLSTPAAFAAGLGS